MTNPLRWSRAVAAAVTLSSILCVLSPTRTAVAVPQVIVICPCDWDESGGVPDSVDFFAFLQDFFANDADFNNDKSTTSQDFFDFLNCFFQLPDLCRGVFCMDSSGQITLSLNPLDPKGELCDPVTVSWGFSIPCVHVPEPPYDPGQDIALPVVQYRFQGFSPSHGYFDVIPDPSAPTTARITNVVVDSGGNFVSGTPVIEVPLMIEFPAEFPFPLRASSGGQPIQLVGGTIFSLPPTESLAAQSDPTMSPVPLVDESTKEVVGYVCDLRCASPPAPPRPLPTRHACPAPLPAGCRTMCPTGATVTLVNAIANPGGSNSYGGLFRYTFTPAATSYCVEVREVVTTLAADNGCNCRLPLGAANPIVIALNLRCTGASILDRVVNRINPAAPPPVGCVTTSTQMLQCRPKGSTDDAAWATFQTQTMTFRRNANGTIEVIITPMGGVGVSTGEIPYP